MNEILVVMALAIESQQVFERAGISVLYTGLGKVNAAYALTRRLFEGTLAGKPPPALVLNFGSAGSRTFATGSVVACREFVQRDMDVTGLGFERGVTPMEDIPAVLEFPEVLHGMPHGICGSGDKFETIQTKVPCDVVDMEGYALAKVCRFQKIPFACAKYITDGADETAAVDWQTNLPKAAAEFLKIYRNLK